MKKRILMALCLICAAVFLWAQVAAQQERLVKSAKTFQGVPYKYGAESPDAFDCSGFVRYVYKQATGLELPRSSRQFLSLGHPVERSAAQPGDIFVFNTVGTQASHVALFIGNDTLIHAVSEGPKTGVIQSPVGDRYWSQRVMSVRRVLGEASQAKPGQTETKPQVQPTPQAAAPAQPKPQDTAKPQSPKPISQIAKPIETIVDIGFDIPAQKISMVDPIPTIAGTSIAFTVTNATGKAGSFIVQFYVIDAKTYKLSELHKEKVSLAKGSTYELPAYRFEKAGKYKLVVKGDWGDQLLERSFVVEAKKR